MAASEEPSSNFVMVDELYEFSAPRFYDFLGEETEDDVRKAELWFEKARPYAPSPFMPRIKANRNVQHQILCNFDEAEQMQKAPESSKEAPPSASDSTKESSPMPLDKKIPQEKVIPAESNEEVEPHNGAQPDLIQSKTLENVSNLNKDNIAVTTIIIITIDIVIHTFNDPCKALSSLHLETVDACCTPAPQKPIENKKTQTAKRIASILKNPSQLNSMKKLPKSLVKSTKPASVKRDTNSKNLVGTPNLAHENPAIKRQKLEDGKSRQILTIGKPSNLPHKTRTGLISSSSSLCSSTAKIKTKKEDRKMYVREQAQPFVSTAEMMRKFQSGTREMSLSRSSSISQNGAAGTMKTKPRLTLTRPKTPEFETSQRVRSTKIKSSAELEEEAMAKIPKFKARPLNKKIFEAPALPPLPRSTPHPPEFKEFHLVTMSRAIQNAETSTVVSTESTATQNHQWKPNHLTAPKSPLLQTSLRARPPTIKSTEELEKEELENIPQFKARPLNKKIFESKGEMGIFSHMKKPITIPEEFHFAIDKRITPPVAVVDLFDKLSINSQSHQEKPLPRNTTPNPFHLHTEERGAQKEKRIAEELLQKQREEERARIPKAHPYPYTTDYPVIPPKPEPKPCTKPEPFQLESLLRHEEEMQREMEQRRRTEMEEAEMRKFKAQPILNEDPIPVPVRERKPLTEVQEFNLHVEHRAADRAEFDKKIKEKEMAYKRYREEEDSARMMEEEKALKQLRRTLVPHARPVPNFEHPFLPQKSVKDATKAKSPKLRVDRRKEKRRVVFPSATAAHHIR
ncbi:Protein TPX2 [Striga hermonthica]|uniref:Protein TPX2 n=1 Tax=Striga hermonthica TaxID=68872 RepID=A0A9N7MVZ4_STRHE|nr:Protein TPX2 [Striga hermonthica]